jgi:ABC-type sugar transport system ATPase subunit
MHLEDRIAIAEAGALPAPAADAVVVDHVTKSFGEARALRACSFSARRGEVHAVVGENGSGKSTMAKLLAGVLPPDSGSVAVNGAWPASPQAARRLGVAVVFQEILVAEGGTVLDNLFLGYDGLFRPKLSQKEKRARAQDLLNDLVGTSVDLDALVDDLSLNTRQWIVITRALLSDPGIVVFDESTAALDHSSVERFFDVVRKLRAAGVCVLIVTHRIHELTAICDRATVLSDGVDVGTLEGNEITEARLLQLMRGETSSGSPPHAPVARSPRGPGRDALVVTGVKLTPQAAPVEFTLRTGEIVGLAGLEGHGQAEFIQVLTGFRKPAAGQVTAVADGRPSVLDSARSAARSKVAYIAGDRKREGLFANLSVIENFSISRYRATSRAGLIDRAAVGRMFAEQVEALSIRLGRASAAINSLSGGNQQKVVIGRSLAGSPLVIALNDPTRGVDIGAKRDLYDLLRRLADEGRAILFLSNEIEEFVGLCDRVMVFRLQSEFATLSHGQITSDAVLAAMFGYYDVEDLDSARH